MGVTIAYNDTVIHQAESGDTFTLNTDGKYMNGDIVVAVGEDDIPSAEGEEF